MNRLSAAGVTVALYLSTRSGLAFSSGSRFRGTVFLAAALLSTTASEMEMDFEYPGTAAVRMHNIRHRVKSLKPTQLNTVWEDVRRSLLWAGGLRDLPFASPGAGYTGHSFNDYNHCDLTAMRGEEAHNTNKGQVTGIHYHNKLGNGIKIASIEELGPGGSWSTCMVGCHHNPPQDVAHIQFRSRIAFKLVWSPNDSYKTFVLVDDNGHLLNRGTPTGTLPPLIDRQKNYKLVEGSKFAYEAEKIGLPEGSLRA